MADESPAERWRLVRGADIPASLRLTLYALHCFQGSNRTAFCKRETLADEVGVNVDNLSRKLTALEQLNIIASVWTQRNGRPSREHSIDYSQLKKMQRPTLTISSECEAPTLTIPTVHSDDSDSCTLTNSSDMKIHRRSKNNPKGAALQFSFPKALDNEQFKTAWAEWVTFRREIKKRLTASTVEKQLAKLAAFGSAKAIRSIELSIENGWQGLFDPDQRTGKASGSGKAEQAWQAALDSLNRRSRFKPDEIMRDVGERSYAILKAIGLKRIDEASDYDRRELKTKFILAFSERVAT